MLEQTLNRPFSVAINEWQVEIKIYEGLQNAKWNINQKIVNKLVKIFHSLPDYKKGIPNAEETEQLGCLVYNETGSFLIAYKDYVIGLRRNIIEVKMDGLDIIKNELLRTCPADLYRNVNYFFQDFRTKTKDIVSSSEANMNKINKFKARNYKT